METQPIHTFESGQWSHGSAVRLHEIKRGGSFIGDAGGQRGRFRWAIPAAAIVAFLTGGTSGAEIGANGVKSRWSHRLDSRHFVARVVLQIERDNKREERRLDVWRSDDPATHLEKVMLRFERPEDMRGLALLYLERKGRPNDYFLFQPALQRVRRIPEAFAKQDVYGVDLEYLGLGGALLTPTEVESVEPTTLDGRRVYLLTEHALEQSPKFERRRVWLDAATFVPWKVEHELQGEVTLCGVTESVAVAQGVATPLRIRFDRPLSEQVITMTVDRVDYEEPIPEDFFTTFTLVKE